MIKSYPNPISESQSLLSLSQGLAEFVNAYMPARNYSRWTRDSYRRDVEDLTRFLKVEDIEYWNNVGLRDLQHYLAELEHRELAATSRNRKTHAIKVFFKFLYVSKYLNHNPAAELIPPKISPKACRFLSKEEYQALLAQVGNSRDRAIIEIFLQTGIRLSELLNLTTYDIALPKRIDRKPKHMGLIKVKRKGGAEELLPLNWKACEAVATWLKDREVLVTELVPSPTALFLSRRRQPISRRAVRYLVKKYMARAGIQNASVHTLRHTAATHLLAGGVKVKTIQKMLGHKNLSSTQIYLGIVENEEWRILQDLAL